MKGVTLRPGDENYTEAASVYTRTGSPSVIVRARQPEDVVDAVAYAVARSLPLSIRSGGHSGQGWGTNDGGIVIDLRSMADIEVVDESSGRVRIGTGAVWGDVADRLRPHGLALTSGDTRSVGVGGIATSGGIGWMVRTSGLTIDSIISAQIVTADGRVLETSRESHPDLFWAIRGGGGNYGVITSIECLAQKVGRIYAGHIHYRPADLRELLRGWARVHRGAPDELNSTLYAMRGLEPAYTSGVMGVVAYIGDDRDRAAAAVAPLLALDGYRDHDLSLKAYADVLATSTRQPGTRPASTNTLITSFDDSVSAAFANWFSVGTEPRMGFVRWLGGEYSRTPATQTAFAHRSAEALVVGRVFAEGNAEDDHLAAMLTSFDELHRLGMGSYQGFLGVTTPADLSRIYPPSTLERLRDVKRIYDPKNVFHLNYNVTP